MSHFKVIYDVNCFKTHIFTATLCTTLCRFNTENPGDPFEVCSYDVPECEKGYFWKKERYSWVSSRYVDMTGTGKERRRKCWKVRRGAREENKKRGRGRNRRGRIWGRRHRRGKWGANLKTFYFT